MHRALLIGTLLTVGLAACVATPDYQSDVSQWQEVSVPSDSNEEARGLWSYAANYSRHEWRVYADRGQIYAHLTTEKSPAQRELPKFTPKVRLFEDASAFARVDDGWLVGFNKGEWGGA